MFWFEFIYVHFFFPSVRSAGFGTSDGKFVGLFPYVTLHEFRLDSFPSWFFDFHSTLIQRSSHFRDKKRELSLRACIIEADDSYEPFFSSASTLRNSMLKMKVIYAYGMLKQFRINCTSLTQFTSACAFPFLDYGDNDLAMLSKPFSSALHEEKKNNNEIICLENFCWILFRMEFYMANAVQRALFSPIFISGL